jgi:hypothetical protein
MTKKVKRQIHKTCPTWGITQCYLPLWSFREIKSSYRWHNVTCKKCLKQKHEK